MKGRFERELQRLFKIRWLIKCKTTSPVIVTCVTYKLTFCQNRILLVRTLCCLLVVVVHAYNPNAQEPETSLNFIVTLCLRKQKNKTKLLSGFESYYFLNQSLEAIGQVKSIVKNRWLGNIKAYWSIRKPTI